MEEKEKPPDGYFKCVKVPLKPMSSTLMKSLHVLLYSQC